MSLTLSHPPRDHNPGRNLYLLTIERTIHGRVASTWSERVRTHHHWQTQADRDDSRGRIPFGSRRRLRTMDNLRELRRGQLIRLVQSDLSRIEGRFEAFTGSAVALVLIGKFR